MKTPYINDLQKLIANYNSTEHSTVKAEPEEIWTGEKNNQQIIKHVSYDFVIGDRVRHAVKLKQFDKASSTEKYTKQIYNVSKIDKNAYFLIDKNGKELTKKFRGFELKHAVGVDTESSYDKGLEKIKKKEKLNRALRELN